jgi:molecular chaperone GrpE (heat shock protein)
VKLKAKVASDVAALKAGIEERKHDRAVARTENYAEMLEDEAAFAIDYAISSVEQAKLAVLDAIVGRADAERARAS